MTKPKLYTNDPNLASNDCKYVPEDNPLYGDSWTAQPDFEKLAEQARKRNAKLKMIMLVLLNITIIIVFVYGLI